METNAARIGEKWLPYCEPGTEYSFSVHSVFDRVVNVATNQGLLSVAADEVGGSSAFLTVPGKRLDFSAAAGESCVARSGCLCFSKYTVNFNRRALWKGPVHSGYRRNPPTENIAAFKAVLDRKAAPESAWRIINSDSESRFSGLKAIRRLRKDAAVAGELIGLGRGLTPAGDDMLLGFLAAVNHVSPDRAFVRALGEAVSASLGATTDLSAQALKNALDRDYHEFVQKCIRDLCEGAPEEVYISAAALLKVGATSGSDIACGMYFGMNDK
jgi:hypothetical protein